MRIGFLTALGVVLIMSRTAQASYITQYSMWDELPPYAKVGYVMGLTDTLSFKFSNDDENRKGLADALGKCLFDKKVNANMIVEQIDKYYEENRDKWDHSPMSAFLERFTKSDGVCAKEIYNK